MSTTALPNTKDAIGDSWTSAKRHARRIARHGRHVAEDIGGEMRELLAELEQTLTEGTEADADDYVRENPWQAIVIVGGVALVAGALLSRGR
ncbi:DUF883 family protein [Trinickia terrae]|uniref:DUF883 family protein n=1 Tax=Trinickia terrae TaxID=2571161 RepID=A0A4U1IBD5_9BURK|nr:DUF883 C-terminal domain-containing protein [Trinickia terrae]TKC90797.1 DUF883 family protein [Trinickia terrae]